MKIAVGLSGGVDSAVAALLLKRAGHEVVGVTMKLWREGLFKGGSRDACFGPGEADDIAAAEAFASRLGIEYRVFDCSQEYAATVLAYFRSEREAGRTPNPCVVCNRRLKFGLLPAVAARALDFDRFATGHYARVVQSGGRLAVARAADEKKDQSYFLYRLSQRQLAEAMFPLGELAKPEVRRIAAEHSLSSADKADSQDFYSGDRAELVGAEPREGEIVDLSGRVLGHHRGYWNFTVGQRKGLGAFGPEPMYVVRIDACRNQVVLGRRNEAMTREFRVANLVWQAREPGGRPFAARVKIRSTGAPLGPVEFDGETCRAPGEGLFGVAPGQSAVFYDESGAILCGGVIEPPTTNHEI